MRTLEAGAVGQVRLLAGWLRKLISTGCLVQVLECYSYTYTLSIRLAVTISFYCSVLFGGLETLLGVDVKNVHHKNKNAFLMKK